MAAILHCIIRSIEDGRLKEHISDWYNNGGKCPLVKRLREARNMLNSEAYKKSNKIKRAIETLDRNELGSPYLNKLHKICNDECPYKRIDARGLKERYIGDNIVFSIQKYALRANSYFWQGERQRSLRSNTEYLIEVFKNNKTPLGNSIAEKMSSNQSNQSNQNHAAHNACQRAIDDLENIINEMDNYMLNEYDDYYFYSDSNDGYIKDPRTQSAQEIFYLSNQVVEYGSIYHEQDQLGRELKKYILSQLSHHISDMIYYIGIKKLVKKLYITANTVEPWQNISMNNLNHCIKEIITQTHYQEACDIVMKGYNVVPTETEASNMEVWRNINIGEFETLYLVIKNSPIDW